MGVGVEVPLGRGATERVLRNGTCADEGSGSRADRKVVDWRALWKIKSAGFCDYLDAGAKKKVRRA